MTTAIKEFRATLRWNKIFKEVNQCKTRYRILKGSAGSGKSLNTAQDYIKKLSDEKYKGANLLVVRKIEESNRHSTFAELQSAVYKIFGEYASKLWKINLSTMEMQCITTGNTIIFRGIKDLSQREKVKSISFKNGKLCWIWVEEATELLAEDIDILDDRLRGELDNKNLYYQMTMTLNPVSATHWIKSRYFDTKQEDVFTHHSTYKDNRFIDEAYYRRMERRAREDPEGYRIYGLGEWGELGGLILTNIKIHDFQTDHQNFDGFYYGQDFGFNHANAILGIGWKDGDIYVCNEIYVFEKDTGEIIEIANKNQLDKEVEMWCDSAEPDRIKTWKKAGYRAKPVRKEKSSVKAQIDWLKKRKIHIHPSCINTIKEIQQWKWKKDNSSGLYIDEPLEVMDDAMAALRYSIERLRRGTSIHFLE